MKTKLLFFLIVTFIVLPHVNGQFQVLNDNSIYLPLFKSFNIGSTEDAGERIRIFHNSTNGYIDYYPKIHFRTGATNSDFYALTLGEAGVGVNRTEPRYNLDIIGSARVDGDFILTSDERLKENIHNISGTLNTLTKLQAVTYRLKLVSKPGSASLQSQSDNNRIQTGFLAQDLQKVYPDLVFEDQDGILSINYIGLIPILVEAVKELSNQNAQNIQMQTELEQLKQKLDKLETDLAKLQQTISQP